MISFEQDPDNPIDEAQLRKLEESFNKVKRGEAGKLYPVLKPGTWAGVKQGAVWKPFRGTVQHPELVVACAYDFGSEFMFLMDYMLEGRTREEAIQEAMANLADIKMPLSKFISKDMIFVATTEFCSEKILSRSFLLDLHEALNAKEMLVSVPRRRTLLAVSTKAEKFIRALFIETHLMAWWDDSSRQAPISNVLFIVERGIIKNITRPDRYGN